MADSSGDRRACEHAPAVVVGRVGASPPRRCHSNADGRRALAKVELALHPRAVHERAARGREAGRPRAGVGRGRGRRLGRKRRDGAGGERRRKQQSHIHERFSAPKSVTEFGLKSSTRLTRLSVSRQSGVRLAQKREVCKLARLQRIKEASFVSIRRGPPPCGGPWTPRSPPDLVSSRTAGRGALTGPTPRACHALTAVGSVRSRARGAKGAKPAIPPTTVGVA